MADKTGTQRAAVPRGDCEGAGGSVTAGTCTTTNVHAPDDDQVARSSNPAATTQQEQPAPPPPIASSVPGSNPQGIYQEPPSSSLPRDGNGTTSLPASGPEVPPTELAGDDDPGASTVANEEVTAPSTTEAIPADVCITHGLNDAPEAQPPVAPAVTPVEHGSNAPTEAQPSGAPSAVVEPGSATVALELQQADLATPSPASGMVQQPATQACLGAVGMQPSAQGDPVIAAHATATASPPPVGEAAARTTAAATEAEPAAALSARAAEAVAASPAASTPLAPQVVSAAGAPEPLPGAALSGGITEVVGARAETAGPPTDTPLLASSATVGAAAETGSSLAPPSVPSTAILAPPSLPPAQPTQPPPLTAEVKAETGAGQTGNDVEQRGGGQGFVKGEKAEGGVSGSKEEGKGEGKGVGKWVATASRKRALVEEADALMQPRYSVRQTVQEVLERMGVQSGKDGGGKEEESPTVLASSGVSGRHPPGQPLIPVYVGTEKDQALIREQFLWRVNDTQSYPQLAAQRLSREIGLPTSFERIVEDSINAGLKQIRASSIPADVINNGAQHLVEIELSIKVGRTTFKDKILWDLLDPLNMPETYAHTVCEDLKLGTSMYEAINKQLHEQIELKLKEWVERRRQGKAPPGIQLPEKRARLSEDEAAEWAPVVTREAKKSEAAKADGSAEKEREGEGLPPEAVVTFDSGESVRLRKAGGAEHEGSDDDEEEEEGVGRGDAGGGDDAVSDGGVLGGADAEEEEDEEEEEVEDGGSDGGNDRRGRTMGDAREGEDRDGDEEDEEGGSEEEEEEEGDDEEEEEEEDDAMDEDDEESD